MSTSVSEPVAKEVWFDDEYLWVLLADGRRLAIPLAYFPRLLHASPEQRLRFELSGGGIGIHWQDIDEDVSVPGLLLGVGDQTRAARKSHSR